MRSLHFLIAIMLIFTTFIISYQPLRPSIATDWENVSQHEIFSQSNISYSGGNGTKENPFQISNISQLQYTIHNLSSHFKIVNDIDASATSTWNNGSGFVPIGNESSPFNGTFDGGHYKITGLWINRSSSNYVGLIGYATNNTEITNMTLISCEVEGYDYVGGLIAHTSGNISDCSMTGEVKGRNFVGGIVGRTYSNRWRNSYIEDCFSISNVSGRDSVGGLAGLIAGVATRCSSFGNVYSSDFTAGGLSGVLWGSLYNSFSAAEVNGKKWAGGLIGIASIDDALTRCIASGNISGTRYVGGLIGSSSGYVNNCSAHGDVTGEDEGIGGLIGTKSGGVVENCFSTGPVTAVSEAGGLIGVNRWKAFDCYCTGKVTASSRSGSSIGDNQGTVNRTYFNNQTSGISVAIGAGTTSGATGKTLEDMLQNSTFVDWNFTDIWGIGNGQTYPYFKWKENEPPMIITPDVKIATIGAPYVFKYKRSEKDTTDILPRWDLDTNADWLQVNSSTGMLQGMPGSSDLGPYFVNISVNDGRDGIDFSNFTLTMNSTNNIPVISTKPLKFVNEDDAYYVDYEASTDIGDILEWSLISNATWLELNSNTGALTGYPDHTEIGSYSLNVTVTDGQGAVDWQEFTLTVNETNDDPIITTRDVKETYEHLLYNVHYTATDEENDAIMWSFKTNASWLSFNKAQRLLSGRPGYGKVGEYWVNLTLMDVRGGFDHTNFTLIVVDHPIPNGSGTISDPFVILNATQLQSVNLDLDAHYVLGQNIDANETRNWNDGKGFIPIASDINMGAGSYYRGGRFNGTFDGKGYTIGDLYMNRSRSGYIGLFGYIDVASVIRNVNMAGVDITGGSKIGGLVGSSNWAHIRNCNVEGRVSGNFCVGGLVGYNFYTSIQWCNVNIEVNGSSHVGGLVGWDSGSYEYCRISECSSRGMVQSGKVMGGLVGYTDGAILRSFSNCIVNGTGYLGGFIGVNDGQVQNCYSTGDVYGTEDYFAGFGGSNGNLIERCYSTGRVTSITSERPWIGLFIGGRGYPEDSIIENRTVHIEAGPYGNVSLTYFPGCSIINTGEMIQRSTFIKMGWDLNNIWSQIDNHTYPYFSWQENEAPSIVRDDNLTIYENISYRVNYTSIDPDPTDIYAIWSIATNAGWLSMDGGTGVLSGNASNDDLGTFWVNITASDGRGGSDWHNITIQVMNTNTAPMILTRDLKTVLEDEPYIVDYEGIDIDPTNDILAWSLTTYAGFLSIDEETGVLSGYPTNSDVGDHWVKIVLFDDKGSFAIRTFILRVINTNDPPRITTTSIPDAIEDDFFSFTLTGDDIDPSMHTLSWSIIDTNADFMELEVSEGRLKGYPENEDVGPKWISIALEDGNGGMDIMNYSFNVQNTNDPPEIITSHLPDAIENVNYSYTLEMEDPDKEIDEHLWTLKTSAAFLNIDPYTGQLFGIPGDLDAKEWDLTVRVQDSNGIFDIKELSLKVIGVNDPPLKNEEQKHFTLKEDDDGITIDLDDLFFDLENDPLEYSVDPTMNISAILLPTGHVKITSEPNWSGTETIVVIASDGELETVLNISVRIEPVNDPPEGVLISYITPFIEGSEQIVDGFASDPDLPYGDRLNFTWSILNMGIMGTGRSINLSLPAGSYELTLKVTDSEGAYNESSLLIVIESPSGTEPGSIQWYNEPYFTIPLVLILLAMLCGIVVLYIRRDRDKKKREEVEKGYEIERPPSRYGTDVHSIFRNHLSQGDHYHYRSGPQPGQIQHFKDREEQIKRRPKERDLSSRKNEATHIRLENLIEEALERFEDPTERMTLEEMEEELKDRREEGEIDSTTYAELIKYLR